MTRTFKLTLTALATLAITACQPTVPDSGPRGAGFSDPVEFARQQAERDAALAGSGSTDFAPPATVSTGTIGSSDLAAAGIGRGATTEGTPVTSVSGGLGPIRDTAPLSAMGPSAAVTPAAQASDENPAFVNPSISDEQDFGAVASRETIQSDADRRAQNAAQLEIVQPIPVPERSASAGPNIVQYALNAPNVRGQEWYSRSLLTTQGRFRRNCAAYNSADAAQRDFLARGGPEIDRRGLDPDGDGFACGWDPAPFVSAAGN